MYTPLLRLARSLGLAFVSIILPFRSYTFAKVSLFWSTVMSAMLDVKPVALHRSSTIVS